MFRVVCTAGMVAGLCIAGGCSDTTSDNPPGFQLSTDADAPADDATAAPPEDPLGPPPDYTLFYDQGDHFEELIEDQRYLAAALLIEREKRYFVEVQEEYRDQILLVGRKLNEQHEAQILEALAAMNDFRWPTPVENWPDLRVALLSAQTALDAYNEVEILRIPPYRSEQADLLSLKYQEALRRLDRFMVETFILYDHFERPSFFDMWPVALDAPQFMAENFALLRPRLETASRLELIDFLAKYPREVMGETAFAAFSNLYAAAYVRDLGLGSAPDLRSVLDAFRAVQEAGFAPTRIAGQRMALVQVVDSEPSSDVDFPISVKPDVTAVEVAEAARDQATLLPMARDADVLIIVDVVGRDVSQQAISVELATSTRPAGAGLRLNPAFEAARERVIKARRGERMAADVDGESVDIGFDTALDILLDTPPVVEAATYQPYEYERVLVEGRKLADINYYVADRRRGSERENSMSVVESQSFTVVRGLRDDDPNYQKRLAEGISEADWSEWQQAPFEIKVSDLLAHYLNN